MKTLTKKEIEVLLILFKDFSRDYNANSLSKTMGISPRGALKMLKNLWSQKLLISKQLGKAVFYKVNLDDEYVIKLISVLLMNESREKASRWLSEFKDLLEHVEIGIIFGSIIRNHKTAKDIDILIVFKEDKYNTIEKIIEKRRLMSTKTIHQIKQTSDDLIKNLKKKDEVILNIIRKGYVLHGFEKLVRIIKNVTSF